MAVEAGAHAPSDLRQRVAVGVAAGATAILALALGGYVWWFVVAAVAIAAAVEWDGLVHAQGIARAGGLALIVVALLFAAPPLWGTDRATVALLLILALVLMLLPRAVAIAWGMAYVGVAAIGLLFLREQPQGFALALWTLLVVWATDVGAYFAGRRIGGAKLAPRISPNKTWAGLGGGVVAAVVVGAIVATIGHLPAATLWLGAPLAIAAQAGDLLESWLKRRAGVKDSGRSLPGHGGLLDRIDGLLPVAILVAALVANGNL